MAVEQPAFGGRRHIGELVPVARLVAVFFGQCRESGEVAHGDALLRGHHRRLFRAPASCIPLATAAPVP